MLPLVQLLGVSLLVASADSKVTPFLASSFAGATTSAVFPPPSATNVGSSIDALFPSDVGFPGPTPTGDEAEVIATATAVPKVTGAYPLQNPDTFKKASAASFDVLRKWGNLSPMFSVDSLGLPKANELVPKGCEIEQVHLIHRHGARYPASGSAPAAFATKLQNATAAHTGFTATGDLAFLNTWTYKLGAELLTPFGRGQMLDLGVAFRIKYGQLLKGFDELPVFRTTSEDRMLHSALNLAAGFFGVPMFQTDYHQVITIENDGFNNTLAPYDTCTNANNAVAGFATTQANAWLDIYAKTAVARLAPQMKGINLTATDIFGMQMTCAYETVALGFSEFCDLFTEEEWDAFDYWSDLSFWYGNGPGNPATTAQGIGFVQELVARLTQTPLTQHNTTTNGTITDSPLTFPLRQPIFVDSTHDTVIANIITALNFTSLAASGPLPTDHIPKDLSYRSSNIAPFGATLVGQVLSCPTTAAPRARSKTSTYIRWLLNDAVVPLTGINGCKEDANGLCAIETFISAMQTRIGEVDFDFDCFGNYSVPVPDLIVDGRAPKSVLLKG